jgi:hypothetical protein
VQGTWIEDWDAGFAVSQADDRVRFSVDGADAGMKESDELA